MQLTRRVATPRPWCLVRRRGALTLCPQRQRVVGLHDGLLVEFRGALAGGRPWSGKTATIVVRGIPIGVGGELSMVQGCQNLHIDWHSRAWGEGQFYDRVKAGYVDIPMNQFSDRPESMEPLRNVLWPQLRSRSSAQQQR